MSCYNQTEHKLGTQRDNRMRVAARIGRKELKNQAS